eukprot:scaffold342953_cov38-Prasinocladus_malaysianus.AAC.1
MGPTPAHYFRLTLYACVSLLRRRTWAGLLWRVGDIVVAARAALGSSIAVETEPEVERLSLGHLVQAGKEYSAAAYAAAARPSGPQGTQMGEKQPQREGQDKPPARRASLEYRDTPGSGPPSSSGSADLSEAAEEQTGKVGKTGV